MTRAAAAVALAVSALSACGGTREQATSQARPVASGSQRARQDQILSLAALGSFEGLCPRGARVWRLRFAGAGGATETVSYRVGSGASHIMNLDPGHSITIRLVPNAARTHEPADRFVPRGQPRGLTGATSVATTASVHARIYQATEPQTLRADVRLALSAIGDESGQCVMVGSTVDADSYPNSR